MVREATLTLKKKISATPLPRKPDENKRLQLMVVKTRIKAGKRELKRE